MNYLLFGGQPNSGKTSTITRLTSVLLAAPFSFRVIDGTFSPLSGNDFLILLERKINSDQSQYIIINSPSDDRLSVDNLGDFIVKHSDKTIDVIISSVRDINWERDYFFETLKKIDQTAVNVFEIPLARITRRRKKSNLFKPAKEWYDNTIDRHINFIITNPPFNL